MRWIMVSAKEWTRMWLPRGTGLDWNCCWALLRIVWSGTFAGNVQSTGPYCPQAWLWHNVWLNGLHILGVSIMWSKHNCSNTDLILYKSDVSTAYHQLLMHPLYQILQIVTVGSQRYINRSNDFGGHASQIIWQSFMSLVIWILQVWYRHIEMLHQQRLLGC